MMASNRAKSYARSISLSQWSISSTKASNKRQSAANARRESKDRREAKDRRNTTASDRRKTAATRVKVRCPHKANGCEWVGDSDELQYHVDSCSKRPWRCKYCNFISNIGLTPKEHIPQCGKYPVACPNGCEIGNVPREDLEKHRDECPLEPVDCEFADAGCRTRIARRYLSRHLEACQQQHMLSATLLNLKLTKEAILEKDRIIVEKDEIIAKKDSHLAKRDRIIAEKDKQLAEKDKQLAEKERVIAEMDANGARKEDKLSEIHTLLKKQSSTVCRIMTSVDHLLVGSVCHKLTLRGFSECQKKGDFGDWYSEPLYSHPGGYKLRLNIATNGAREVRDTHLSTLLILLKGESDAKLPWPVTFAVTLRLLNQFEGGSNIEKMRHCSFTSSASSKSLPSFIMFKEFIPLETLRKNTQYLRNDSLTFHLFIHTL